MNSDHISHELEAKIAEHPLIAIAVAFAAGAVLSMARRATAAPAVKRSMGSLIVGGLGTLAMGFIKNAVLEQVSGAAKQWLDPEHPENAASRDQSVESFLEH
jgi:hypothetical protein